MSALGCSRDMKAVIRTRGATQQRQPLHDVLNATWSRVLDGTSEAQVIVPIRNKNCCEGLARTRPWSHELALFRSGELVWEGPIVNVIDSRFESTITLQARDVTAWLGKRRIHLGYDYTGNPTDLSFIAQQAIRDALGPDDPDVLRWMTVIPSGVLAERQVDADVTIALDEINDMSRTGLNYTTVGRRIILFSETVPIGEIGTLSDDHFVRGVPLQWNGAVAANNVAVIGEGVVGRYSVPYEPYGLLEASLKTDGILDQQSADTSARLIVNSVFPPPLIIASSSAGALKAKAPVDIAQLVPGVAMTISARGNCESVVQRMRLEKLDVTWSPEGEEVSPSLAPVVEVG